MIIGFDGKRAINNNTGLGNYSRLLVQVLAEHFPQHHYRLYAPEERENARMKYLLSLTNVSVVYPDRNIWRSLSSLWRVSGVAAQLQREKVGLMHGLSGELPLNIKSTHIPSIVTMHDLIFRRHPECYKVIDRKIYDYKFRKAAENATRVLAISECTKRDIIEFYNIPSEKIDVVYQGCDKQFHRTPQIDEIENVKRIYGITYPYIISVGTIESRKNQLLAVKGMRGLPADFHLVLVGRRTDYAREIDEYIAAHGLANRIHFISNVAFAHLPALYAGAVCSSYTSRYEGFGIPVIESLNAGTPVIVAKGSCLEEAAGVEAPAISEDDVDHWIHHMNRIINDGALRLALVEGGRRHVAQFTDEAMAVDTMKCYKAAMAQFL